MFLRQTDTTNQKNDALQPPKKDGEEILQEEIPPVETEEKNKQSEETGVQKFVRESTKNVIQLLLDQKKQVVAIGDSLTQGVGDLSKKGGYIGILNETLNKKENIHVQFENFGKRGNRTDQMLKRLDEPEIINSLKEADIVLITVGANDIMQVFKENFTNLTLEQFEQEQIQYEKRLVAIFNKIRTLNSTTSIYLLGFYNPFDKYFKEVKELKMIVNDWNHTGEQVTQTFDQTYFIPTNDLFNNQTDHLLAEDNFHPNERGYKRIAERVLAYLLEQEGDLNEKSRQ